MAINFFGRKKNDTPQNTVVDLSLSEIIPNRFQPRRVFNEDNIAELAQTIAEHGLLQPIIVREYETNKYEIIAGERRFRAVTSLKWEKIPAIVQQMTDQETASMALIENLQREELSPIEEATAYQRLLKLNYSTQAKLGEELGKSQSFIANKLRLLNLAQPVQDALLAGKLTERHGRVLLKLNDEQQVQILPKIIDQELTVQETEKLLVETFQLKNTPHTKRQKAQAKLKAAAAQGPNVLLSKQTQTAVNTLKHSVKKIRETGLSVEAHEERDGDKYRFIIEISKDKE